MSDEQPSPAPSSTGLAGFVLENRSWMQPGSLLMIVYAVWAVVEVLSNTWFHDLQALTLFETGTETNIDPDDLQRNNSGPVIASGAVLGLFGLFAQYVYRGAPMVDASMAAAAAMILDQASADRVSEKDIIAKAEDPPSSSDLNIGQCYLEVRPSISMFAECRKRASRRPLRITISLSISTRQRYLHTCSAPGTKADANCGLSFLRGGVCTCTSLLTLEMRPFAIAGNFHNEEISSGI